MKLALVTLHYKNLSDTLCLLDSISKVDIPQGTVLATYVVDNEGSAVLADKLEKEFPRVRLIIPGTNLGFAAGNNLGFTTAIADQSEILVAINNDTYVEKDFIKTVIDSPINDSSVGAVGGLIYFAPGYEFHKDYKKQDIGKVIWYAGGKFDWGNILGSNDHVDEVDRGQLEPGETTFITGALFVTRASVLQRVGLFDEKYFMYLEDVDLSLRIKSAGYRLVLDPQIKLWHKVAQSSGIGSGLNDYFITRNRLYFGMKYASIRTNFALLREAVRLLFTGRSAQRRGVLDFFTGRLGRGSFIKS